MNVRTTWISAALALLVLAAGACSSSGSKGGSTTVSSTTAPAATTTAPAPKLTVLVTNDDGYDADGIDLIVQELLKLPNITVTVVAPAKNRSGTGSTTTPGALTATVQKTKSGYRAIAVDGFPADTITYALNEVLSVPPDLVVSGINFGQNIGPFVGISGTVGAAKAAAAKGIPAIAASSGAATNTDYATAARVVIDYVTTHRADYDGSTDDAQVININVPTCTTGSVRGVKQVPAAKDLSGRDIGTVDCNSTATSPVDDVDAFVEGFAALTVLDARGTTVTATTAWTGSSTP